MIFSPGIYEHAAALIERTPWEVSRSGDLLAEAHRVAWECYHHPLIVAGIDVYNLEPEVYGAVVSRPTAVVIHTQQRYGRLPTVRSRPWSKAVICLRGSERVNRNQTLIHY